VTQLEEAIEDLKQALLVDPGNKEVQRELGQVQSKQRQADDVGKAVYKSMLQAHDSEGKEG